VFSYKFAILHKINKSASKVQIFFFIKKKYTFFLHISKKSCTFAAQNNSFAVFSPRRGNMSKAREGYGHIEKGVLSALFWHSGISQIHT